MDMVASFMMGDEAPSDRAGRDGWAQTDFRVEGGLRRELAFKAVCVRGYARNKPPARPCSEGRRVRGEK